MTRVRFAARLRSCAASGRSWSSATSPRAAPASASSNARCRASVPRTLSLRLRALEEEGIVERQTFPEVPPRVEYALTDKGRALVPLIEDMRAYGLQWLLGDCAADDLPVAEAEPVVAAV